MFGAFLLLKSSGVRHGVMLTDVVTPPLSLVLPSCASLCNCGVRHNMYDCIVYDVQLGGAADHVAFGGGTSYQRAVLAVSKCRLELLSGCVSIMSCSTWLLQTITCASGGA